MSLRFNHMPALSDYDPEPILTSQEAADLLEGIHTPEAATHTQEFAVRRISPETIDTMQRALDNLQAMPENPAEQ